MENNYPKNSIRVIGVDKDKLYDIIFVNQKPDGSFYWGICSNKPVGHFSRHKSGKSHMTPSIPIKSDSQMVENGRIKLGQRSPLDELKHNEQTICLTLTCDSIKDQSDLGMKEYKNKKTEGIFSIDLRRFPKNIGIHVYLIGDESKISQIFENDWYENGEFYYFVKSKPKLVFVAFPI